MLLIPTRIEVSPVHGLGLFTAVPVRRNQLTWAYDARVDRIVPDPVVRDLPEPARTFFRRYAYRTAGGWVLCGDDARFMNHSTDPTVRSAPDPAPDRAARDLAAGEELTCDYRAFDDHWDYGIPP